jgi:hypothetical protein
LAQLSPSLFRIVSLYFNQEKIPDAEKIGTKPKRLRFGRNYELEDITQKHISLSELPEDKLLAHLGVYKDQLYSQFRNTVMDTGKQVEGANFINVSYKGTFGEKVGYNKSPRDILCDAKKKITLSTFRRDNQMFQKLNLDRFFPKKSLLQERHCNTRAVVSSAGSLKDSGLGSFIDAHDKVLRFNNALTDNHAKDVGKKTSIRIVVKPQSGQHKRVEVVAPLPRNWSERSACASGQHLGGHYFAY